MKTLFTIFSVFIFTTAIAQKTEFRLALNSGLFHFAGPSAASSSQINYNDPPNPSYTNNPYGSKNGLCIGVSGNLKRVTKHHFISGLDFGIELLQSKILIEKVASSSTYLSADGRTYLKFTFVNVSPFLGGRFNAAKMPWDLTGGLDIAYCLNEKESGKATTSDGRDYSTSRDRTSELLFDVRPRIQLGTEYRKFGAYLGYSIGLANYMFGYIGGVNECYARLFRFGLTYLLN